MFIPMSERSSGASQRMRSKPSSAAKRPRPRALLGGPQQEALLLEGLFACQGAAWLEFLRLYDRLILSTIGKVLREFSGVVGQTDIDDVYGELLVALSSNGFRKLRSFDSQRGMRLSSWIVLLTTRATWDYLRAVKRRNALNQDFALYEVQESGADALSTVIHRQQCEEIIDALQRMSERDNELVQLLIVEGRAPEDVATELGISVKTVYTKKHKILTRLSSTVNKS